MMDYLGHSARNGAPSQSYSEHVEHVIAGAVENAKSAAYKANGQPLCDGQDAATLVQCTSVAGYYHDLGKLFQCNQEVLHNIEKAPHLPINHVDAGTAALLKLPDHCGDLAALMVYSHHRGLPNILQESLYNNTRYRDKEAAVREKVDAELHDLLHLHETLVSLPPQVGTQATIHGDESVFCRMGLSCLADADHTDTAMHYNKYPKDTASPNLRAVERLEQLNNYVSHYNSEGDRNRLRREMYRECRDTIVDENIAACDSPVGSGKTTAVMAHLLTQAIKRDARRIFVVLPYTNIISQSVKTYREALTLPGEDPVEVVAELHHRADFQDSLSRAYSAQWRAPVIVTTAVAFFETLASNKPSALRKLHELPGSVIFVDEAHAALPVKLMPLAWRWMQIYADQWNCYWLLASGSLVEFWNLEEISNAKRNVRQLVGTDLRHRLAKYEQHRIKFSRFPEPLSCDELYSKIKSTPGPRIVIVNTVQTAAVLADGLLNSYGISTNHDPLNSKVMHLSTALNAEDRENSIQRIKERLEHCKGKSSDDPKTDWTLVATSCVEAGVDFSFHSGFRELASLLSLLQAAGRVGRNGEYSDAEIWTFRLQEHKYITQNPSLQDAQTVLERYFDRGKEISPRLCTGAIQQELEQGVEISKELISAERNKNFSEVCDKFKVISEDTVLAVTNDVLKQKLRSGQADWKDIQRMSVSIRANRAKQLKLPVITEGVYDWNLRYNSFLGIMAGVLDFLKAKDNFLDSKENAQCNV